MPARPSGLLGHIDLALLQALQQIVGGQVNEFNLISPFEDGVGDRLADNHAGNLRHDIIQAFDMLHIERGVDVDPGGEEFLDILPAFGMPRARGIRWVEPGDTAPNTTQCETNGSAQIVTSPQQNNFYGGWPWWGGGIVIGLGGRGR